VVTNDSGMNDDNGVEGIYQLKLLFILWFKSGNVTLRMVCASEP